MRSVNNSLNEHSRFTSMSSMEDLILNSKEHRLLKKFRKGLQKRFCVEIRMPEGSSCDSDIIFVSVLGHEKNRECVKKFLSDKMIEHERKNNAEKIPVITLSDSESSESELSSDVDDSVIEIPAGVSPKPVNDSVIEIPAGVSPKPGNTATLDDSVCILAISGNPENNVDVVVSKQPKKRKKRKRNPSGGTNPNLIECPYLKLTQADYINIEMERDQKRAKLEKSIQEKQAVEFIPLQKENKCSNRLNGQMKKFNNKKSHTKVNDSDNEDDVIVEEPGPPATPRRLRPIVIDGSNIAREHGKTTHSFSVKGIQIAIDYFLERGHTQVTAFVPRYRRNSNPNWQVPTKDASILDDLEKKQYVVFTPSRRVNNQLISSYDDRYIVKLAAANGGVIVSNDNYRDLINESESYKEAIEKRLLMFCFVGDMFMVPDDPLGRNGPTLNDFLSFPPDEKET